MEQSRTAQRDPIPNELKAVVTIFNADNELRRKALPHVNIERQSIDWDSILDNDFGGGHSAAVAWSRAIWQDQAPGGRDLFDRAFAMDGWLKGVVLKALAIRWGLLE
jgi:hypothetical protein